MPVRYVRFLPVLAIILGLWMLPAAQAAPAEAGCVFGPGFQTLHDTIPLVVGGCTGNETRAEATGDVTQTTTNGLLLWRVADNWTAFTDGVTVWINGPCGLQQRPIAARFPWEQGGGCDGGAQAPALGFRQLQQLPLPGCEVEGGISHDFTPPNVVDGPATLFSRSDPAIHFWLQLHTCSLYTSASARWDFYNPDDQFASSTSASLPVGRWSTIGAAARLPISGYTIPPGYWRVNLLINGAPVGQYWTLIQ